MTSANGKKSIDLLNSHHVKREVPDFRPGDTVRVHAKIVEGTKERIQVFEGVVLKRNSGNQPNASFTVRKISYNVGVERTFPLYSPRIDKIEVLTKGKVRRARLFYLRPLRGKAMRIKSQYEDLTQGANNVEEISEAPQQENAQEGR